MFWLHNKQEDSVKFNVVYLYFVAKYLFVREIQNAATYFKYSQRNCFLVYKYMCLALTL